MRVFWIGIKYIKSASRLLNRHYVNRRGLDLYKEVLCVSLIRSKGSRATSHQSGLKKRFRSLAGQPWYLRNFFHYFFFQIKFFQKLKIKRLHKWIRSGWRRGELIFFLKNRIQLKFYLYKKVHCTGHFKMEMNLKVHNPS